MKIFWHDSLDSTNDEAARRILEIDDLSVIAAREQYKGRGQRGNRWHSAPGDNLTFSVVLKGGKGGSLEGLEASEQFAISRMATLVVRDFLASEGLQAKIKWPNDIYAGNRKICGMLIENSLSGKEITRSIIGIGLNLNEKDFPPGLANPTSLAAQTGRETDPAGALERICGLMSARIPSLSSEEGRESLDREYSALLYRKGEWHEFRDLLAGEIFEGRIDGVAKSGLLKVSTREGLQKEFGFKEIGYII